MHSPPLLATEQQRLSALRELRILDTPPEAELDEIAELAAVICETPMAMISLVDAERQWFKARVGCETQEAPREISFCAHTLEHQDILEVPDATKDERFAGNPMVLGEPGIRYYAGAPLITSDGLALGALCVADRVPRQLEPSQLKMLTVLARNVMTCLELRREIRERRDKERMLQAIFDANPDCTLVLGAGGETLMENAAGLRRRGVKSVEEVAGQSVFPLIAPSHRKQYEAMVKKVFSGELAQLEFEMADAPEARRTYEIHAGPLRDEEGAVTALVGVARNISLRKAAESRALWLIDSNAHGVFFWNMEGAIFGANDAFLELVGYSREDLEAGRLNWRTLTPAMDEERDRMAAREIQATGACRPYEKHYIRKDGSLLPLLLGSACAPGNRQEGVCFAVDLTRQKEAERDFLRLQRMETIGALSSGLAHDLGNVLAPIVMATQLLQLKYTDPKSRELVDLIEQSARRGAEMMRRITSFASGRTHEQTTVQVGHITNEVMTIIRDTFRKNIEIQAAIPADLPAVVGDPTQLHQVLLNLCLNARDAMPAGGTLRLSAQAVVVDEEFATAVPGAHAGHYVVVEVQDTGTGIAPEHLGRIYETFFTTKPPGLGTGLGLSSALGIVVRHGGFMQVQSELQVGTKFQFYLKAQEVSPAPVTEAADTPLPRGQGELILLVDDEAAVREITKMILENFGYRVTLATDAVAGTSAFEADAAAFGAVITDQNMPGMEGSTMVLALRKIRQDIPIIMASGLPTSDQARSLAVEHYLQKPFTAQALLEALHDTFARRRRGSMPAHSQG